MIPKLPEVGEVIGKYRIDRIIGRGGMGVVFEATHKKLGQTVAIKMLVPELLEIQEITTRFEREGRAAARLRHRNSARVIDVDQTEAGLPYIVMELLHGHDLEAELEARGRVPIGDAVHFVLQAAAAMIEAHANGTVHRDLKPSNLFLNGEADGSTCLKVLDFGISKVSTGANDSDVHVTSTQTQMGTPLYMSPEQVRSAKHVDGRSDIWSLGVILYELLAGEPPFQGSAAGIGAAIVSDQPKPLREIRPEIPEGLAAIVTRAMEKDPAARHASMQDFAEALSFFSSSPVQLPALPRVSGQLRISKPNDDAIASAPTVAAEAKSTAGNWTSRTPPPGPRRAMVGIIALLVLGAGGFAIWFFAVRSQPKVAITPPPPPSTSPVAVTTSAPAISAPLPIPSASVSAKPTATATATFTSARPRPKPSTNPDRL